MKIKLSSFLKQDNSLIEELNEHNIEIAEDSKYELVLSTTSKQDVLAKTNNGDFKIINIHNILYFESFDNNVYAVTTTERLVLKEKLYYFEEEYSDRGFIRVSKSFVVNISAIKKIETMFNRKFILIMSNKDEIDVNRSYYSSFKERIGL